MKYEFQIVCRESESEALKAMMDNFDDAQKRKIPKWIRDAYIRCQLDYDTAICATKARDGEYEVHDLILEKRGIYRFMKLLLDNEEDDS